ncbi:hypothetical protein HYDPIDRAFT_27261 [Hydnomerulius pinastri MD-312]|nr:hypothetical protein HYDPIDRAFT_27261 [Hydnomerulius pinastri MD-312]
MVSKSVITSTLALFAASALGCSYSNRGDGFEMYVYADTDCGTSNGYEQFWGSGDNPLCDCYDLNSTLNDKVKSFTFTASSSHSIGIFENAGCSGSSLGHSTGEWMDTSVSSAGQKMSSFQICLILG